MLQFAIRGSTGNRYDVVAARNGDRLRMSCTCEAGRKGVICRHRIALLQGDVSALASRNDADVLRLTEIFEGTTAQHRYLIVCAVENEIETLKARLKKEKHALARELAD